MPAQIVLAHAPIGRSSPYGDGRAAIVALDRKYLRDGESRMQELHDELSQLKVTAKDDYDPSPTINRLRRICAELDMLGDRVIFSRKKFVLMKALPDQQYAPLIAIMRQTTPLKKFILTARQLHTW